MLKSTKGASIMAIAALVLIVIIIAMWFTSEEQVVDSGKKTADGKVVLTVKKYPFGIGAPKAA